MAIEIEKIKPWDGQSGTGADNRGVIDRNFDKVGDKLEAIDSQFVDVNTKFDNVEDEVVQLAGDVLKGKYDFKREFNQELNSAFKTVLFNYPLLANDILNLKFEFSNITNDQPSPQFDFGGYDDGFGTDRNTKYFKYVDGAYVYEHQYVPVQDYPQFAMFFRPNNGTGDFKLTISNDRTILKVVGDINQINNKLLELPKVSSTPQFATVARKNIDPAERLTGAIHTRTNNLNKKVFERYTGETVEDWLNPSNWKNIESTDELINKIPMGDDIQSCNITSYLGMLVNINGNVYEATGNGVSIYPRIEGFIHEPMKAGHKYFITFKRYIDFTDTIAPTAFQFGIGVINELNIENQSDKEYTLIYTPDSDMTKLTFRLSYGTAANSLGVKMFIRDFMVFDLTEFFGAGKEPTVDNFKLMIEEYGYFDGSVSVFDGGELEDDVRELKSKIEYRKRNDERYLKDKPLRELDEKIKKYDNTIQSLRKIKTATSGELSWNIQNKSGVEQKDVTVRLYLHKGDKPSYADDTNFDVWMGNFCNDDFSDIRFLDSNGNLLDNLKYSSGNYSLIPDSSIGGWSTLRDGRYIKRSPNSESHISEDGGVTWDKVFDGLYVGENTLGDLFYYKSYGDADLFKTTKASGFTSETLVHTANEGVMQTFTRNFQVDDIGHIFLGEYKAGPPSRVFRSTDNGDTFQPVFESESLEHVHGMLLDKSKIPYRIYVNHDGSSYSGEGASTYYSDDRGDTWVKYPLILPSGETFNADYGVFYVAPDGSYTIGGGEGGIKGTPTIFKTVDGISYPKVNVMQNTFKMEKLGDALYCAGTAYWMHNRYAQIYRSDDEGDTWSSVNFIPYSDELGAMQYGYRFGSEEPLLMQDGQYAHLLRGYFNGEYPQLRILEGGDNYQAQYFIKIPKLPANGMTLRIGYGYLAEDVEGDMFEDKIPNSGDLLVRYKLDEFGATIKNSLGDKQFIDLPDNWIGGNVKHYGWLVPVKYASNGAAAKFDKNTGLPIKGLNRNKNFTLNVWWRMTEKLTDVFVLGRTLEVNNPNNMFFFRDALGGYRLVFKYGTNEKTFGFFQLNETLTYDTFMFTMTISDDIVPIIMFYINGVPMIDPTELTGFDNNMDASENWRLGGAFDKYASDESTYWSDLSIFDGVLSQDTIRQIFESANFIKI